MIKPGIVTKTGETIYPTGYEWLLAFAIKGFQWAIDDLNRINPVFMKSIEVEKQLFDWNNWEGDLEYLQFFDCQLKVRIGVHQPGSKFPLIAISFEKGKVYLYPELDSDIPFEYDLELKIKES